MGVPKFYRWLSERYPCLSEVIRYPQIPEFDNLYLDMNGIIHTCSHPNDDDVHYRITEEQIVADIFRYIEILFKMIRPRKVFFMAIDGVAPRAKMNQQRARRFMSARNAEVLIAAAKKKGVELPKEERFDSNCITPGTEFMARLHAHLQFFVQMKISTDEDWRGIRIFLSGHDCPGEGEHKIMDFIRSERANPDYDSNTRHCLYGLDADLIMLGMCSHEPHFSLLREEVKFVNPKSKHAKRATDPERITFHLLHLSLLREYLAWEFYPEQVDFEWNMESLIDDWVLMGFLVGNDFIPHLPHVHIHDDALPALYTAYMKVLPKLGGYLNESGILNLGRFEIFLEEFAKNDRVAFTEHYEDDTYMDAKSLTTKLSKDKKSTVATDLIAFEDSDMEDEEDESSEETTSDSSPNKTTSSDSRPAFDSSSDDDDNETKRDEQATPAATAGSAIDDSSILTASEALKRGLIGAAATPNSNDIVTEFANMDMDDNDGSDVEMWTNTLNRAFKHHKRQYYTSKLKYANITREELRAQAEGYIRAIQWNLHYYYHGCRSWNWYYPHHYAPYLSDIRNFADMNIEFELSEPFHPFEQLLAVLPAASSQFLPKPFQELMIDPTSPIIDFYPTDFMTDLNGKKNDWEAVVLIPFINEDRLLSAISTKESRLTDAERARNMHGPHLLYTTGKPNGPLVSSLPSKFDKINRNMAICELIDKNKFQIPIESIYYGLLPGVKLDIYFPGFPTMKHLPHTAELKNASIRVFQSASRRASMILRVEERKEFEKDPADLAHELIGKEVHIDWPMMQLALVESLSTAKKRYFKDSTDLISSVMLNRDEQRDWQMDKQNLDQMIHDRYGIDFGETNVLVRVRRLIGTIMQNRKPTQNNGIDEKQWSNMPESFPIQLLVLNLQEARVQTGMPPRRPLSPRRNRFVSSNKDYRQTEHNNHAPIAIMKRSTNDKQPRVDNTHSSTDRPPVQYGLPQRTTNSHPIPPTPPVRPGTILRAQFQMRPPLIETHSKSTNAPSGRQHEAPPAATLDQMFPQLFHSVANNVVHDQQKQQQQHHQIVNRAPPPAYRMPMPPWPSAGIANFGQPMAPTFPPPAPWHLLNRFDQQQRRDHHQQQQFVPTQVIRNRAMLPTTQNKRNATIGQHQHRRVFVAKKPTTTIVECPTTTTVAPASSNITPTSTIMTNQHQRKSRIAANFHSAPQP